MDRARTGWLRRRNNQQCHSDLAGCPVLIRLSPLPGGQDSSSSDDSVVNEPVVSLSGSETESEVESDPSDPVVVSINHESAFSSDLRDWWLNEGIPVAARQAGAPGRELCDSSGPRGSAARHAWHRRPAAKSGLRAPRGDVRTPWSGHPGAAGSGSAHRRANNSLIRSEPCSSRRRRKTWSRCKPRKSCDLSCALTLRWYKTLLPNWGFGGPRHVRQSGAQ